MKEWGGLYIMESILWGVKSKKEIDYTDMTYIHNCLEKEEKHCEILDRMRVEAEEKVKEWNKD